MQYTFLAEIAGPWPGLLQEQLLQWLAVLLLKQNRH